MTADFQSAWAAHQPAIEAAAKAGMDACRVDGPAVPEGSEPASVATQPNEPEAEGPSDEALANFTDWFCRNYPGPDTLIHRPEWHAPKVFRAAADAIARWGHPAAAPVPDFGEVAAALKVIDKMQQEWVLLGNDDDGTASPSLSMPISLRRFTVLRDALFRAATLLQQQAAPVPVSERLPGPEDCDAEGRCWLGGRQMSSETPTWLFGYPGWAERFPDVHHFWLPANALPLPAPEGGKSQP